MFFNLLPDLGNLRVYFSLALYYLLGTLKILLALVASCAIPDVRLMTCINASIPTFDEEHNVNMQAKFAEED